MKNNPGKGRILTKRRKLERNEEENERSIT